MKENLDNYQWKERSTSIYLSMMCGIFPLFFLNGYLNILEAKTSFFVITTYVYLFAFIVLYWLESVFYAEAIRKRSKSRHVDKKKKDFSKNKKPILKQDVFFLLFFLSIVISTLCSGDFNNAWYAPECKLFGARIIILCCGVYILVSRGYIADKILQYSLIVGASIVFALSVMNRYGIDLLNMQEGLNASQKSIYVSTIGNVNILSNFVCIFTPLFMGGFLFAQKLTVKIVCAILLYLAVMAGISTNSDSYFLGLCASAIFFLWFCIVSKERFIEFLKICLIIACSLMTLKIFNNISKHDYVWEDVQSYLINEISWLTIAGIVICIAIIRKVSTEVNWIKVRNIVFILLGTSLLCISVYIVIVNTFNLDNVNKKLIFSESWGTNRGFVWMHTWELFKELPAAKQIIGIGPGGFKEFFEIYNLEREMKGLPDFADPHSEFLYYLVSTGVIGVIGYFGMIVFTVIECLNAKKLEFVVLSAILISWIAQGMVNNPIVFTTPYLFIVLGISRYELKRLNAV